MPSGLTGDQRLEAEAIGGELGAPIGGAFQLGVGNLAVGQCSIGQAPLTDGFFGVEAGNRPSRFLGQPLDDFTFKGGPVIHHVINGVQSCFIGSPNLPYGGADILHSDEVQAGFTLSRQFRMTGQDLIEQVMASRAVDPGQSQDGPAIRSIGLQGPLGPAQNLPLSRRWFKRGFFRDPFPIAERIDTGGTGVDEPAGKALAAPLHERSHAFEIGPAVTLGTTATGGDTIEDTVHRGGNLGMPTPSRQIGRNHVKALGPEVFCLFRGAGQTGNPHTALEGLSGHS